MTIDNKIIDENLQYNINKDAAKLSALSLARIGKHEYLTAEEILPSDQSRMIEPAIFIILVYKKLQKNKQKIWRSRLNTKKGNWKVLEK